MSFDHLRIKKEDKQLFEELATKWDRKYSKLFGQMVTYFKKTGYDPMEHEQKEVQNEMGKLNKTLISFIREQEKNILKPIRSQVDGIHTMTVALLKLSDNHAYNLVDEKEAVSKPQAENVGYDILAEDLQHTQIKLEKAEKQLIRHQELFVKLDKQGSFRKNGFAVEGLNDEIQRIFRMKAS
tara:strand:+ start:190 stop:735 length:546 start_codon:yes stop_codon:yes gene_type:complete